MYLNEGRQCESEICDKCGEQCASLMVNQKLYWFCLRCEADWFKKEKDDRSIKDKPKS